MVRKALDKVPPLQKKNKYTKGLYTPEAEKDACGVGFVVHVPGVASYQIVKDALILLKNLEHRGAEGADGQSGDGAGILTQIPHVFLESVTSPLGIKLPSSGQYGVGMLFLPQDDFERRTVRRIVKQTILSSGFQFLGWRSVPVDGAALGSLARLYQPRIRQFFVGHPHGAGKTEEFERQLYQLRKKIEHFLSQTHFSPLQYTYILSLSAQTIVYKGMLKPSQLDRFYLDLKNPLYTSALALVHSRFSTNTFPSWTLAQPFRNLCHNGEINTIRGNRRWMKTREKHPLLTSSESDSASLDKVLELLHQGGRSLAHSSFMLIPDPWDHQNSSGPTDDLTRDFFRYHSLMMEPWDGPAAICFTNGRQIGAKLDRNGLRPLRYFMTQDERVILASEAGAVREEESKILLKGRVGPGQILLIDTEKKNIRNNQQIRQELSQQAPYKDWLSKCAITLDQIPTTPLPNPKPFSSLPPSQWQQVFFGYSREEIHHLLLPMAQEGKEVVSSMGNDTPLAVFSKEPQLLFNYFRQLFAQVTNPAIDPLREYQVMSLTSWLGPQIPLAPLEQSKSNWRIECSGPILSEQELENIIQWRPEGENQWVAERLSLLYTFKNASTESGQTLEDALENLLHQTDLAVNQGVSCLVLSDQGIHSSQMSIPSLLAVSAVHQHLIRQNLRSHVDLVIESGEPRSVHHMACLLGFGASAIVPYLAYQIICSNSNDQKTNAVHLEKYRKALGAGLLKIFSKMGISTLQSYKGGQIFEALGLNLHMIEKHFTGTASRLGGLGLSEIERETFQRHQKAHPHLSPSDVNIPAGNQLHFRPLGEKHSWHPQAIENLQRAVRTRNHSSYKAFSQQINEIENEFNTSEIKEDPTTLRNLLQLRTLTHPLPLDQVESAATIVRKFTTGAMSLGALSKEVHESLAQAMNQIGGKSNSGEGGEDPIRYDSKEFNSAIKQIASGRFGVTASYLRSAREIQIKIAQGAKPGEGGQLPGDKVDQYIGRLRHATPGVPLISPPPHHDIYSIEDLKQLIYDLRQLHPKAAISVKLVSQSGVGTVAAGVAKAYADKILISGDCGGTGAAPFSSIKHAGSPWELGLAEAHQTLILNGLRERVRLETDGQLRTGRDVVIACLLGADEFGFSTAPLITQGCIMMRKCHLNTCPVGVATQDPILRKRFKGSPEYLIRYFFYVAEEVREIMAQMGFRKLREMRGRVDRLTWDPSLHHYWKLKTLDLSPLLHVPESIHKVEHHIDPYHFRPKNFKNTNTQTRDHEFIELIKEAVEKEKPIHIHMNIFNTDLSIGTHLSGHLLAKLKELGQQKLKEDQIQLYLRGSAGQSLGAFLIAGIKIKVEGEANDYVGKGLSGGKIILTPSPSSSIDPAQSIILGNTALYGATSGELYAQGCAGERFAVRNSGATAVVEGVGDHGCEYMTGGVVVILGSVGRNFAAGMSGGRIYVWDQENLLSQQLNKDMAVISPSLKELEEQELKSLITSHLIHTGSHRARFILDHWEVELSQFRLIQWQGVKVILNAEMKPDSDPLREPPVPTPTPVPTQEEINV